MVWIEENSKTATREEKEEAGCSSQSSLCFTVKIVQFIGSIQNEPSEVSLEVEHLAFLQQLIQRKCAHHF